MTLRQALWRFIRQLNHEGHTIILTTHYLEEAEVLCNRVAMLKQGRIVALDSMQNLISGCTCHSIRVKLSPNTLPEKLQKQVIRYADGMYYLKINNYVEIESVLMILRESGIRVLEMSILQSDLEEVFVNTMMHEEGSQ